MKNIFSSFLIITTFFISVVIGQESDSIITSKNLSGIKFRSVGPAFMSGRIADIAFHPTNNSIWYVAVGSGGVWKTVNSGTTWEPIFDKQKSYSIGCVTIDPNNPNIIWVGTGENIGGRHVGYGDGIYKSEDGGASWKNMGLKESQHISKIIVNPTNSNIIYVAAQGPLWNKGGDRGFYKSTDFGNTWEKTLGDDKWTGVTDIVIDPRDPNLLYAATWQRHRNVAAYIGGGPGSGIHRSINGGETWEELKSGLPKSNMGKIGLAISLQKPDVVYAAIELDRRKGAVYRSENRGASWVKMSDAVSGATGPHYYQELYACPHNFDKLYLMDVRTQVSNDGGKSFKRMSEKNKHSDNHAIAFRMNDPSYIMIGSDGGLYETFDNTKTWRFISNLPVTQFYKLAVDDSEPFYNIYGGTQDNATQGGPSRTDNVHGIRNSDWKVILGGDGHQPATEPGNPNIVYAESQEGYLSRIDISTGEIVPIQPQPDEGEPFERFNWDSPILVSPHKPSTIYFASQRVWKSEDRGDSWIAISGDLTKNQNRLDLPIMDKKWSWDSAWDVYAMSNYNTITSISESPKKEGLIYIGTDDGLIQITENGGKSWQKLNVGSLPNVPSTAFVNDIKADLFDVNSVYVVLDNHKFGDLNPYLLKSEDRGKTWKSIKSNLPERTLLWRIVQDYVKPELLFVGTDFGVHFSLNGGKEWIKLKGGVPPIPFRDLAIQKRENDLVGATFGRSFYVLDDFSFLRDVDSKKLKNMQAELFTGRDALLYIPKLGNGFSEKGAMGASFFTAKNPPYGAVFTYYISDAYTTLKSERKKKEKKLIKENKNIDFPGWDYLEDERKESKPKIWLTIKDLDGNTIRKIEGKNKSGFHRTAWDLKFQRINSIDSQKDLPKNNIGSFYASPGTYTVTLSKEINGVTTNLTEPKQFNVKLLHEGTLAGMNSNNKMKFYTDVYNLQKEITSLTIGFGKAKKKVDALIFASDKVISDNKIIKEKVYGLKQNIDELDNLLYGNRSKREVGEKNDPTILRRLNVALSYSARSIYGPTKTQIKSFEIAKKQFVNVNRLYQSLVENDIPQTKKMIIDAGGPIVE